MIGPEKNGENIKLAQIFNVQRFQRSVVFALSIVQVFELTHAFNYGHSSLMSSISVLFLGH